MTQLEKTLYTTKVWAEGGRAGRAESADGRLKIDLSTPAGLGGDDGPGTNPEQLFAAGYAACFMGAMRAAARKDGTKLPDDLAITAEVGIGPIPGGFGITVAMDITVPSMDRDKAQAIIDAAHGICPYSNATRGNVDVRLTLAGA